ncbi:Two-component response regulator, malate [Bacillus cereus]|nr:Two-component response regulator, malate [Bacillus cereus]
MIKVLIVEDDPMVAMLNTHYLEQVGGFELVQAVNSVKSAIKVLEESRVDLVLLDIFMPEETGFELLMHIRLVLFFSYNTTKVDMYYTPHNFS